MATRGSAATTKPCLEVAQGIHRIVAPLGTRFNSLYLLVGDRSTLLVDTGLDDTPRVSLLPYLDEAHVDRQRVRFVLNTHSDIDHMGGNASVRELLPDAVLMCHVLDRPMVEDVERIIM